MIENKDERIFIIVDGNGNDFEGRYIQGERSANEYIKNAFYLRGLRLDKRLCEDCKIEAKEFLTKNLSEDDHYILQNKRFPILITAWISLQRNGLEDDFEITVEGFKIKDIFYIPNDSSKPYLDESNSSITFVVNEKLCYIVDDNPMLDRDYLTKSIELLLYNNFRKELDYYIDIGNKTNVLRISFLRGA